LKPKQDVTEGVWEVWVQAKTVLGAFTTGAMLIAVEHTSITIENGIFENLTENKDV